MQPGPDPMRVKPFMLNSTELDTFVLLINVNMPTIVGIITLMERINTTFERYEAVKRLLAWVSNSFFMHSSLERDKCFINSGPPLFLSSLTTKHTVD